jgi:hypothetical protein
MKKIRILSVSFNSTIKSYEIPAFRGAVAEKAGRKSILFHNHDKNGYKYRYPLIQYKSLRQHPVLLCIDEGVDEIHHFFQSKDWDIYLSGRRLDMSIEQMNLKTFTMQVWDKQWHYSIHNWIALNQKNVGVYNNKPTEQEKKEYLEKILTGNILSFAKGINWTVDKQITTKIQKVRNVSTVNLKGNKLLGFHLDFSSNVFLPNHIGLGKGVSHGYGIITMKKN